jgi:hypothetical protein
MGVLVTLTFGPAGLLLWPALGGGADGDAAGCSGSAGAAGSAGADDDSALVDTDADVEEADSDGGRGTLCPPVVSGVDFVLN